MANSANILVVEDDAAINDVVCTRLKRDGHNVQAAFSGTEARLLLQAQSYNLVITDLMLPGIDGEEVVRLVRGAGNATPILVISARSEVADKVGLLAMGADDYLVKPFDLDELSARVAVQLRRGGQQATATLSASKGQGDEPAPVWSSASGLPSEERLAIGQWEVLPAAHVLRVAGEELELTRTEFALVELLARHPRRVFSKQALYEHVWGECYGGQESTISAHVSNLRTKLKPTGTDGYIQTVWGLGFRLVPPDNL
ncbi:response regulator transcription factor [Parvibacter caecicola]|uniref:DNA-binding response OmpR family regulator n=1 Tax=Parvibacter caecicola TaxID=747645 RepID=A0A3N0AA41_9ACTN|nr:response regulator transcription factor [Parvibacter caecicola]MBB3171079.1 DNA-binding response OmpR family regulator [Parvibacter caecicola]MCR2042127.1 response regulator transcription factor [Parvibacter caecicola]RNL10896.1 DNA-binding response regulator [Parvibacter caecicola]TJW11232.1 response regulator transcription factor [Parvibacter caecicola]